MITENTLALDDCHTKQHFGGERSQCSVRLLSAVTTSINTCISK